MTLPITPSYRVKILRGYEYHYGGPAQAILAGDALGMPGEVEGSCLEAVDDSVWEESYTACSWSVAMVLWVSSQKDPHPLNREHFTVDSRTD